MYNTKRIILCIIYIHTYYIIYGYVNRGVARLENFTNDWFSPGQFNCTPAKRNPCLRIFRFTLSTRWSTVHRGPTPTPNRLCATIVAYRVLITGRSKLPHRWRSNGGGGQVGIPPHNEIIIEYSACSKIGRISLAKKSFDRHAVPHNYRRGMVAYRIKKYTSNIGAE